MLKNKLLGWTITIHYYKIVLPEKNLHLIQNTAVRVLTGTRQRDHISTILASLHWLPVKSISEFKILALTYKVFNNQDEHHIIETLSFRK